MGTLDSKLMLARAKWRKLQAGSGLLAVLGALALVGFLGYHSDRWMALSVAGRTGWLATIVVAASVTVIAWLVRPLRQPIEDAEIAVHVERRFPQLGERLLSSVELAATGAGGGGVSTGMIRSLRSDAERLSAPLSFEQAVPTDRYKKVALVGACLILLMSIQTAAAPQAVLTWAQRILMPGADIPVYANTRISMAPGDSVSPRGEAVDLTVKLEGVLVDKSTLHYRVGNGKWAQIVLDQPDPTAAAVSRVFTFHLPDLQQDLTYYATANDGRANPHTIRVEDRPAILKMDMSFEYPAYTGKPPVKVSATAGNILAPVGSSVKLTTTATKPLSAASLQQESTPLHDMEVSGETASATMSIHEDGTYRVNLWDMNKFDAKPVPEYTVTAVKDRTPVVQLQQPGADIERTPNGVFNLAGSAEDDYGIQSMQLAYSLNKRNGAYPLNPSAPETVPAGGKLSHVAAQIGLSAFHLKPGDSLAYHVEARDGDTISGPHIGKSALYNVRIISNEEMRERIDAQIDQEKEALNRLIERQKEAIKQLTSARQKPADKEQLARAESEQRQVAQETREMQKNVQRLSEQMRDNKMAGEATLQRRNEMSSELDRVAQNEMTAAANSVQRAQADPAQRNPELSEAAKQEQAAKEALERLNGQTGKAPTAAELAQKAEHLAQDQQKLAEQSDLATAEMGAKPASQMTSKERQRMASLANQQEQLRKRTAELQKQVDQAAREAKEAGDPSAEDLQKASEGLSKSDPQSKQQRAEQQLKKGSSQDAAPQQAEASRDLQRLADNLDQAGQKQMSAQQAEKRAQELVKLSEKMFDMANAQTKLTSQMRRNPTAEQMKQLSQQQGDLQKQVGQAMQQMQQAQSAQQSAERASQNMQRSKEQLDQSKSQQATPQSMEAAKNLMRSAQDLQQQANSIREEQQARAAQRKAEQLAKEQRELRSRTEALEKQRKNGNLTAQQEAEASKLAQQQSALSNRTDDMKREMDSNSFRWAAGEAKRRMDNAQRALEQKNTNDNTQRQQESAAQVLDRLARSLGQQADSAGQQAQSQQSGQSGQQGEEQMAQAAADLRLAREMEAQIRQDTASIEQRRSTNPGRQLTAEQQQELNELGEAQNQTRQMAERAANQLRSAPQIADRVQKSSQKMQDIQDQLRKEQTGSETQGDEQNVVDQLDTALRQVRQQMRQQRQQMAQAQQQGQQKQGQMPGQQKQFTPQNQPSQKSNDPVVKSQPGAFDKRIRMGRGFNALSPRSHQALREGQQERVPAEYRDLVNQYYKALSEKAGNR